MIGGNHVPRSPMRRRGRFSSAIRLLRRRPLRFSFASTIATERSTSLPRRRAANNEITLIWNTVGPSEGVGHHGVAAIGGAPHPQPRPGGRCRPIFVESDRVVGRGGVFGNGGTFYYCWLPNLADHGVGYAIACSDFGDSAADGVGGAR
jgi:hypothetical protein